MSLITDMRKQKAVWWKRSTRPDKFGAYTFADPVEIDCRWTDQVGEFRNAKGEAQNSKAVVYVDRVMSIGDMLMKNEMNSNTPDNPKPEFGAMPIIAWEDTPDFDAVEHLYTAHL